MSCDVPLRASPADAVAAQLFSSVLARFREVRLRANGTSMLPAIRPGDILVMHDVTVSVAKPGDVVLIAWEGRLLAHRIVTIGSPLGPGSLMTQGDAHSHPDPPVTENHLIGRVVSVVRNHIVIPVDRVPHPRRGVTARLLRMRNAIRRVTPDLRPRLRLLFLGVGEVEGGVGGGRSAVSDGPGFRRASRVQFPG